MSAAAVLMVSKDGETLKSVPLQGEISVGRSEGCVIRLSDRAISRQHAVIRAVSGGYQIERKSEFGPISVNGSECTQSLLKNGDVISIGPYLLKVAAQETVQQAGPEVTAEAPASSPELDLLSIPPVVDPSEVSEAESSGVIPTASEMGLDEGKVEVFAPEVFSEDGKTKVSTASSVLVKLVFKPGDANVAELVLDRDEISIGRGNDCDVVLNDKKCSRKNTIIRKAGLDFVIKDLQSANGTLVNGVKVEEQPLSGDDLIRVGDIEFQFKAINTEYEQEQANFLPVEQSSDPSSDPVFQQEIHQAPQPDVAQVAGIAGIDPVGAKKSGSLVEKFRALPKRKQMIYGAVILTLAYLLLFDEEDPKAKKKKDPKQAAVNAQKTPKGPATFESLSAEKKRFVEAQHSLAFDHYRNKDYDKALFEIRRIFELVPDYKDSREIERYALEGKRKLEAIEEERRKKEEEQRLKNRIALLAEETKARMEKKDYEQAKELFTQILSLDPDHAQVAVWRKEIEDFEERRRIEEQQKQVQREINKHAWEIYKEGLALRKQGKLHSAIAVFKKVGDIGASDKKVGALAAQMVVRCHSEIQVKRDPILEEAKKFEAASDYSKAFQMYKKATEIDPPHRVGYAGMERIRGILHDRAKVLYTEAVLAESYSDFSTAKQKYKACLEVAPKDDIYHDRAQRKLSHYFKKDEEAPPQ